MPFDPSEVYLLAGRLGLPDLAQVARGPGVMSVLEISAYQAERRVRHSVARALEYQTGAVELRVAYEGVSLDTPVRHAIGRERMEKLNAVLLRVNFRRLSDQGDLSYNERSLWLIQQAAGAHSHSLLVAPARPELPYAAIVNAIDAYLPEAIREVPLRRGP